MLRVSFEDACVYCEQQCRKPQFQGNTAILRTGVSFRNLEALQVSLLELSELVAFGSANLQELTGCVHEYL